MFKRTNKETINMKGAPVTNARRKVTAPKPQFKDTIEPDIIEPLNQSITEQETKEPVKYVTSYHKVEEVKKAEEIKDEKIELNELKNEQRESTVITRVTVIKGDLSVESNMTIYGEVEGNVTCGGELRIYGIVHGDIVSQHLFAKNAEMIGNVHCEGKLIIAEDTSIEGNITASSMILKGKVIGNIEVAEELFLHTNCHAEGDVKASSIEMETGSYIRGYIEINQKTL